MTTARSLAAAAAVLLALLLQVSLFPHVAWQGVVPNLALLVVVGAALTRGPQFAMVVGFAAETGDATGSVLDLARAKLARKGCDLLVVNDVSGGAVFGSPDNEAVILEADGSYVEVPHGSKGALAHAIWDCVTARWAAV